MKIDAKRHNPKEKRSFINMRGGQEDVTEILDERLPSLLKPI